MILPDSELTGRIIGCAHNLYNSVGTGFKEAIYQSGMSVEMLAEGLEFRREAAIPLFYRGHDIGDFFADFLVEDRVIVELKAVEELQVWHSAQLLNYLRVSGKQLGLLINFGPEAVEVKRRVRGAPDRSAEPA